MSLIQEALQKATRQPEVQESAPKQDPFRMIETQQNPYTDLQGPSPASLKVRAVLAGLLIFVAAFFVMQSLVPVISKWVSPKKVASSAKGMVKPSKPLSPHGFSNRSFVLSGMITQDHEQYAIINDQIVRVGEVIDGATLNEVGDRQVTLNLRGKKITLQL